ncbi:MAG: TonB-dependent receptor [Gemmatimonadetes bacterium]|nr:TonB-dependent receptor [Gemmatimonadota bacterium]MYD26169.1 TonB-dependent receptor [Gemmatimonadota bacterium]MYI98836.1 TonB-dependent receptor [Gemmatimonadota bacterium]
MKTGILYPSLNAMLPLASDAVVSTVLRTFLCLVFVFTAGASVAQDYRPALEDPARSAESDELAQQGPSESPGQSEQAGTESTRPPDEPAIVMEEVVVTARKRAQPAFEVPLSLSTIQEAKSTALRASGMDLRFLSNRVPSLQLESSYGRVFPRIYIRGLGNTDFDLNASQPVSVVYDGIVLENVMLKGYPAFDLDRIEVLRGPQGTLFGRNTPAGIIKLESARPTEAPEGFGRLGYGRFNSAVFEGAVSGPLGTSGLTARLSVLLQRRDDWVENEYEGPNEAIAGYRELAGRLQLSWKPSPDFESLVKLHARDLDGSARAFRANAIAPGRGGLVSGFSRDRIAIDGRNSQELRAHGMSVELRYLMGGLQLVSLTGMERLESFARGDVDGGFGAVFSPPSGPGVIPFPSETSGGIPFLRQISQEVRLVSQEHRPLDYQVGLYYLNESVDIEDYNYDTLSGGTSDGFTRQHQEAEAWAAFLASTLHLGDALEVAGGLRFSHDAKDYSAWRDEAPAVTGAGTIGPIRRNPTDNAWSGDLSMRFTASPRVQTYLRAARGFRAPSIQGRLLFGDEVSIAGTETIHSIEGGAKMRLWDGRLHLDLSAFHYRLWNQQLTAVGGETNFNRLVNADRTLGRGFEAEVALAPPGGIQITGGLSYNHTRIDDKKLAVQPCGAPCTVLDPPGPEPGTVLIDGNGLPQAPRWIADAALRYPVALPGGSFLIASADLAYRSAVRFFLYESVEFQDDRLLECGVRLSYLVGNSGTEISLVGRNVFDDVSLTGGIDFNNLTGFVNEPPYWGVELARHF